MERSGQAKFDYWIKFKLGTWPIPFYTQLGVCLNPLVIDRLIDGSVEHNRILIIMYSKLTSPNLMIFSAYMADESSTTNYQNAMIKQLGVLPL